MAEKRASRARTAAARAPWSSALVAARARRIGSYLGFTKDIPFTQGFRVKAVFENANSHPRELAGAHRGRQRRQGQGRSGSYKDTDMAEVEMEITDKGLPIHKDATLKIRPRIFLEGNFFVDLSPGTPGSPTIGDGDTIP